MPIVKESKEKQNKYWQDRAERVLQAGEKVALEMLEELKTSYEASSKAIEKEIQAFYGRYAKKEGLTAEEVLKRLDPKELKSAKEDIAKYYKEAEKSRLDPAYKADLNRLSARAYMSRLEEIQANIRHEIEKLYGEQQEAFKERLEKSYEDGYYRTMFNIQQGTGIAGSFTALNTRAIEKAVSQKWIGDNYSNRIWTHKDNLLNGLNQTMTQGFILGQNPRVIAKSIVSLDAQDPSTPLKTAYNNAVRLARTEFNHIANSATWDAYEESGVVEYYGYLATLDGRTSEDCTELNGMVFKMSEKIQGVNYPPVHPNCRSTTVPEFPPDAIDVLFETGEYNPELEKIRFEEWRKQLQKGEDFALKYTAKETEVEFSIADYGKKRRVYGKGEGGNYTVLEGDEYQLTGTNEGETRTVPPNDTEDVLVYEAPQSSGHKNGQYVGDDNLNTIFSDGRIVLEYYKYNNTGRQLRAMIEHEIARLGGIAEEGIFYRGTSNAKEINYLKKGTMRRSKNHDTGEIEDGVSVWEFKKYPFSYLYKVSGEVVGIGSDGEPLLNPKTMKFIEEVDPEEYKKSVERGKKLFAETYGWTQEQTEKALRGNVKKVGRLQ